MEVLNGVQWKKDVLTAKPARAARDAMQDSSPVTDDGGKFRVEDSRTDEEKVLDAVCPWRNLNYETQLENMNAQSLKARLKIVNQKLM